MGFAPQWGLKYLGSLALYMLQGAKSVCPLLVISGTALLSPISDGSRVVTGGQSPGSFCPALGPPSHSGTTEPQLHASALCHSLPSTLLSFHLTSVFAYPIFSFQSLGDLRTLDHTLDLWVSLSCEIQKNFFF